MLKYVYALFICISFSCFAIEVDDKVCSPKQCYTVKKFLGSGSFGNVFQVKDSKNISYALKSSIMDYDGVDPFTKLLGDAKREYERGKMLNHANIIKPIEIFTIKSKKTKETVNLILEFVNGHSLYDVEENSVPHEKNRLALHNFIDAVSHGLSLDLLHLDLHEDNVMLTKNHDIKVIDLASFFTTQEIIKFKIARSFYERTFRSEQLHTNEIKIQKFFEKHSNLHEELFLIDQEMDDFFIPDNKMRSRAVISQQQNKIYESYFSDVADTCFNILQKSDLEEKKKNAISGKIELLDKEYSELVKNKKIVNISDYLNKLKKAIN
ncbi:MAG: protein kinase [Parachlamydiaceae bacterium]|nr:protein kinase [Parachlamydiaceae bacterium]